MINRLGDYLSRDQGKDQYGLKIKMTNDFLKLSLASRNMKKEALIVLGILKIIVALVPK